MIGIDLGLGHPVTKLDVASYMYHKYMLDFTPGTNTKYSNFGYLLAGAVVEKLARVKYFDYVKTTLLHPAKISEILVFPTLASHRTNTMAIIQDEGLGKSPTYLRSQLFVANVY